MAVDPLKYRRIKNGMGHEAALYLSDSANSPQKATTVAAPSALTASTRWTRCTWRSQLPAAAYECHCR
jgi:hypothetical protein